MLLRAHGWLFNETTVGFLLQRCKSQEYFSFDKNLTSAADLNLVDYLVGLD